MVFLSSSGCVNITVWMHHMDPDKAYGEKTRREPHKDVTSYFEQIQEATPNLTTAVRPLTSHL